MTKSQKNKCTHRLIKKIKEMQEPIDYILIQNKCLKKIILYNNHSTKDNNRYFVSRYMLPTINLQHDFFYGYPIIESDEIQSEDFKIITK